MRRSSDMRKEIGLLGEQSAAAWLQAQGYTIVERNWRCQSGELDVIAEKANRLIIVEVRTRTSLDRFGHPAQSVEWRKQAQVRRTAQVYIHQTANHAREIQFDVITVLLNKDRTIMEIQHFEQAF